VTAHRVWFTYSDLLSHRCFRHVGLFTTSKHISIVFIKLSLVIPPVCWKSQHVYDDNSFSGSRQNIWSNDCPCPIALSSHRQDLDLEFWALLLKRGDRPDSRDVPEKKYFLAFSVDPRITIFYGRRYKIPAVLSLFEEREKIGIGCLVLVMSMTTTSMNTLLPADPSVMRIFWMTKVPPQSSVATPIRFSRCRLSATRTFLIIRPSDQLLLPTIML